MEERQVEKKVNGGDCQTVIYKKTFTPKIIQRESNGKFRIRVRYGSSLSKCGVEQYCPIEFETREDALEYCEPFFI